MFFSPNICSNPVNNPKLYPTLYNLESIKSENLKKIAKNLVFEKSFSRKYHFFWQKSLLEKLNISEKRYFFRKFCFRPKTSFFENYNFEDNFWKKSFFSSLQMILNLNLNNLHLVLELVYLISALIVEDE